MFSFLDNLFSSSSSSSSNNFSLPERNSNDTSSKSDRVELLHKFEELRDIAERTNENIEKFKKEGQAEIDLILKRKN